MDLLAYQIEEITAAQLQPGEDGQLEQERSRLANLDRIRQAVELAVGLLGKAWEMASPCCTCSLPSRGTRPGREA